MPIPIIGDADPYLRELKGLRADIRGLRAELQAVAKIDVVVRTAAQLLSGALMPAALAAFAIDDEKSARLREQVTPRMEGAVTAALILATAVTAKMFGPPPSHAQGPTSGGPSEIVMRSSDEARETS